MVAFLVGFWLGRGGDGRAVDGFVEDRIFWIMLLHGVEVVVAFEEVLTLAGGVFCADGVAVDALRRKALQDEFS